jgi:hypothetical protein
MEVKVQGLEALLAKWARVPESVKANVKAANDRNAEEFMAAVLRIIPREEGKLAGTLEKVAGKTPTAVKVQIGGPEAPYPAHLEFGHRDGKGHVPAKPVWFPTLRVNRKRFRGRTARAVSAALKALPPPGGPDGQP